MDIHACGTGAICNSSGEFDFQVENTHDHETAPGERGTCAKDGGEDLCERLVTLDREEEASNLLYELIHRMRGA